MSCKHPIYAVKCGKNKEGKNILYLPNGYTHKPYVGLTSDDYGCVVSSTNVEDLCRIYGRSNVIALPCGKCVGCKMDYAKKWSYRCMLEATLYKDNCFLTLTYDDEHLPKDGKVHKEDLQKFMKRLRKKYGDGIRFYACGEYGSQTGRPHYHLILFNFFPPDTKPYSVSYSGMRTLISDSISKLWPYGNNVVGDVTPSSCGYVARYCTKKIYGIDDGSFTLMSRRPGLGYEYFMKHSDVIYQYDLVYMNGQTAKPSRYFDSLLERFNPEMFEDIKNKRLCSSNVQAIAKMNDLSILHFEELDEHEGEKCEQVLRKLKRNL